MVVAHAKSWKFEENADQNPAPLTPLKMFFSRGTCRPFEPTSDCQERRNWDTTIGIVQYAPGLGYGSKVAKIDNQKLEACENPVLRETQVVWLFFWGGKENC